MSETMVEDKPVVTVDKKLDKMDLETSVQSKEPNIQKGM